MEKKQSYVGYKPKEDNLVRLAKYLAVKTNFNAVNLADKNKVTKCAAQNNILKNKRF
jgi:hypothetical protein